MPAQKLFRRITCGPTQSEIDYAIHIGLPQKMDFVTATGNVVLVNVMSILEPGTEGGYLFNGPSERSNRYCRISYNVLDGAGKVVLF